MRRPGAILMPVVTFILIGFMSVYMAYHLSAFTRRPPRTVDAVVFTIEDTAQANGYFTRDEVLIARTDGIARPSVMNGERLSKGDAAFYIYKDAAALELGNKLGELEARIENMEFARGQSSAALNAAQMDRLIYSRLTDMLNARDSRRQSVLKSQTVQFESMVFRREYTYNGGADLDAAIDALRAEAEILRGRQVSAVSVVKAEHSGAFCSEPDGFEFALSMDTLKTMTLSEFDAVPSLKAPYITENNIGKQALGFTWGHIIEIPEESAKLLRVGQTLTLRFADIHRTSVDFKVARIIYENGRALVSLTTTENVSAFINVRRLPSDVILREYTGLRVPKEAIRLDENRRTGVYCLMGSRAVFKPISIIVERENYYLAAFDPVTARTGALLPGDSMIIGAKDIYDGKVYS